MVVQHNLPAMNAHRQLAFNNAGTSKNLEKLSSGFRVNRAADDAAGLAISEKMRGQIRGLDMASQNAENGVSLIQTAEGALNETHAILQRMRELAVQSSNGTYSDEVDRENLNKEVQALKSEIERISTSTHYNGIKLLDGSMSKVEAQKAGATDNPNFTFELENIKAHGTTVTAGSATTAGGSGAGVQSEVAEDLTYATNNPKIADTVSQSMTFQIGANGAADQRVSLDVNNMGVFNLGCVTDGANAQKLATTGPSGTGNLAGFKVQHIDVTTQDKANDSIIILDDAVNQVSDQRAALGALQNRLEHTVNNLGVTRENLQAAESSIRDVDMAKEMMEFTKNNILAQASQSMLAQANQLPQGVLQLLR